MKLILFDIDGRFIDSGGAETRSLDIDSRSVFLDRCLLKGNKRGIAWQR